MQLEALRDFEWYNEASEVSFSERGVKITTEVRTDFWQDCIRNFHKDNGHFFFSHRSGAFSMTVKWSFDDAVGFSQCGLMGRWDKNNWFKISPMSKGRDAQNIGTVVTTGGNSDMALIPVSNVPADIWFRLRTIGDGIYELAYSLNGIVFYPARMFRLPVAEDEIMIGVYICSPSEKKFTAVLSSLEFSYS